MRLVGARVRRVFRCGKAGEDACVRFGPLSIRPQIRRGYPLNLSISISGGEETNEDSPSSGE